jgi:inosine/xanthosine triphosphatase
MANFNFSTIFKACITNHLLPDCDSTSAITNEQTLKKVFIGSENPVKIDCTQLAFEAVFGQRHAFEFVGKSVPSGVRDQPMSSDETLTGATNRSKNLVPVFPDGDFYVGIEGGITENGDEMEAFAWVVIHGQGAVGKAQTATFQLPSKIVTLIKSGIELGDADDMVFGRKSSKKGNGAVGILTHNIIDRSHYYQHAVILALIPFINPTLYQSGNG